MSEFLASSTLPELEQTANAKLRLTALQGCGCSMTALTLNLDSIAHLTHDQFRELCRES